MGWPGHRADVGNLCIQDLDQRPAQIKTLVFVPKTSSMIPC